MELSLEAKGVLAQYIAKAFSHDGISIFAMKVGVNPEEKGVSYTKRERAIYIVNALSSDRLDIAVKAILNERKGYLDYDDMFNEMSLIFERTMSQKIDTEGKVIPLFDPILKIEEKQSYIEKKLVELGFTNSLNPYQEALKIYRTSAKGSIGLLRVTIDDLTKEILNKKGISPYQNFKDRLTQLEDLELLIEIPQLPAHDPFIPEISVNSFISFSAGNNKSPVQSSKILITKLYQLEFVILVFKVLKILANTFASPV